MYFRYAISLAALCGRFHGLGQKVKVGSRSLLVSVNCFERVQIKNDSAVSLAVSGSKLLFYFVFCKIAINTTRHSAAIETILKQCIEITDRNVNECGVTKPCDQPSN